jgi:hypothetical protein
MGDGNSSTHGDGCHGVGARGRLRHGAIGKDTYQLSMTGVGFATQANTNVKALQEANAYCDKLGKHMVFQHNGEAGVYGWSPRQSNLTFLCLNADDPDYVRAKVQPDPTVPPESHQ